MTGHKDKKSKEDAKDASTPPNGSFVFPNMDRYDGEFVTNDEGMIARHGSGTLTTSGGIVYVGSWENDKMNGHGKITFPSGASYEGDFLDNHYSGYGLYTWPNGCVYKGPFEGSKLQGEGMFLDAQHQAWVGSFHSKAAPGLKFKLNL